ncbi:MAG: hypothetical protein M3380_05770, partial [Chloroflexota bacterium]|nr:hypothetical protein [Chloroflexota bacterium]
SSIMDFIADCGNVITLPCRKPANASILDHIIDDSDMMSVWNSLPYRKYVRIMQFVSGVDAPASWGEQVVRGSPLGAGCRP